MTAILEPEVKEHPVHIPKDTGNGGGFDGNTTGRGNGGGGDDGRSDPESSSGPFAKMSPDVFGMLMFIMSEVILFAVLIFAFAWARASQAEWPPPGQPRLPLEITGINTIVLMISGYTMYRAWQYIRQDRRQKLSQWLLGTTLLGAIFLIVQGIEWFRLISFGLTVTANVYGATFYVIIGMHALHVLIAVVMMLFVWRRSDREVRVILVFCGVYLAIAVYDRVPGITAGAYSCQTIKNIPPDA